MKRLVAPRDQLFEVDQCRRWAAARVVVTAAADLAEDIAIEARLGLQLTEEIKDLDERTTLLLKQADPNGILTSAPVAAITAAAILGRLGDPNRFNSLASARAFTGLDSSGLNGRHGGPTKRGDAVLRQALFMAAGRAAASTRPWPPNTTVS